MIIIIIFSDTTVGLKPTPDEFIELEEFKALATLLGPIGMKSFHLEILKQIAEHVDTMKKFLIANQHALGELRNGYLKEETTADAIKKLKNIDEFVTTSMQLGTCIVARQMLSEATRDVLSSWTPLLSSAVDIAVCMV